MFELVCLQFFKPRLDPDRVTRILDLDLDINYYNSNPTEKYFKDTVVCFILTEHNFSSCRGPAVKEAFNLFNCALFSFSPRESFKFSTPHSKSSGFRIHESPTADSVFHLNINSNYS